MNAKAIPKISVVIPCYNEQDNIEKSVDSILKQTFSEFELIIVDDCSNDHSAEIIKRLASTDDRIIYIKNEKNSGVALSLNNGLKHAKGDFIARMDADDLCEPERLGRQYLYMISHPECVLCGTLADVKSNKGSYIQGKADNNLKRDLVKNNPLVHSSVMFKRVIGGKTVRYPETQGFEDYGLWIYLCNKGDFYVIPEVLVHRFDFNNLETKKTWEGFNRLKVYKKLRKYQLKAIRVTGYYMYGLRCVFLTDMKIIYATLKTHGRG